MARKAKAKKPAGMAFSDALVELKAGKTVRRQSWAKDDAIASNGTNIYSMRTITRWEPDTAILFTDDWEVVKD